MRPRILIASRRSDFKNAVLAFLELSLRDELARTGSLYVRFIGINDLAAEKTQNYEAIAILNTCIASDIDPRVKTFLERETAHDKIVMLTTSGDGDWLPDPTKYGVEAISAASKKVQVRSVVAWMQASLFDAAGLGMSAGN